MGSGEPIVLVAGHTMFAADWREMGYTQRLAESRRVISIDQLGHGRSDRPHEIQAYRFPDVGEDVIAVMDAAGIERAPIWGYSRGAELGALAALAHPDRVTALINGGQSLMGVPPREWAPDNWAARLHGGEFEVLFEIYGAGSPEDQAFGRSAVDPSAMGACILGRRISGDAGIFDVPALRRLDLPTLVYCGGEDDVDGVRETAEALGVEAHVIEGLDHAAAFAAISEVLPLVLDFLDSNGV